ncbi:MAG TPA: glycosyltransferase, partial [Isosphaeraceae bacterium]
MDPRVTVVIATRNRWAELGPTLERLRALPEAPGVIVVDNGSTDGTCDLVRDDHPWACLVELGENLGAAARTVGARAAGSPYLAFNDDDSWWAPGSLALAADRLDAHRQLALIAARVLVGEAEALDPSCAAMAASPLPRAADLPGRAVLGFLACGAVVRRSAFLDVGGFEPRFGVGGEEELLAIDLASAGWGLSYCDDIIAHHHPRSSGPRPGRRRVEVRNALWTTWLRRP